MARARNIKPGFFKNETLAELPYSTRLLFIGLWTLADRQGRMEDRPKRVKMEVFPGDDVNVEKGLAELHAAGFINRYEVDGSRYLEVCAFLKHQNPHHREPVSIIPKPEALPQLQPPKSPRLEADAIPLKPEASPSLAEERHGPAVLIPDSPSLIPDSGIQRETTARGTRLPPTWTLPDALAEWTKAQKPTWTAQEIQSVADRFRDFWIAKAGKDATKRDWAATWRLWVGNERDPHRVASNGNGAGMTPYQQMQVEKHEENKRFHESIYGKKTDERPDKPPIDVTPVRVG